MLRIRLIGEMALEIDGTAASPPASRRARSLLAWLALHPGPHARAEVAAHFWPDVLDSSARTNLRSALLTLRNELGPAGARHLAASRDAIGIPRDGETWVDARRVRGAHRRRRSRARPSRSATRSSCPGSTTTGSTALATPTATG